MTDIKSIIINSLKKQAHEQIGHFVHPVEDWSDPTEPHDLNHLVGFDGTINVDMLVQQIQEAYNARIAELIRYNSVQVVSRRFFRARSGAAMAALININALSSDEWARARAKTSMDEVHAIKPEDFGRP